MTVSQPNITSADQDYKTTCLHHEPMPKFA
jgi:hypothetical protein